MHEEVSDMALALSCQSVVFQRELLKRSFAVLQRAEGFFAAAAFEAVANPPHKAGRAYRELAEVRQLLADIAKEIKDA